MSLPDDLLVLAQDIAQLDARKPRQVCLRRAVSTAYYALFHRLIEDAARFLISGDHRRPLREALGRTFDHTGMKNASRGFAAMHPPPRIARLLAGKPIQPELATVASTFARLQQARHEADYDPARRFTRRETLSLIDETEQAFVAWQRVRATPQAEVYLVALLAADQMGG